MVKKPTIKELEEQIFDLTLQVETALNDIETLRSFNETAAISIEQLWELVRDLQGLPVPNGANDVDLRDLV